jgi:hypothetical protein
MMKGVQYSHLSLADGHVEVIEYNLPAGSPTISLNNFVEEYE